MSRNGLFALVSLAALALARPSPAAPAIEVPVVDQPDNFSGAVGTSFGITTHVSNNVVKVNEPITFTVTVIARGPWWQPPTRPRLDRLPAFADRFHIDQSTSDKPSRVKIDPPSWEFDYRLRPLRTDILRVPPLAFIYYKPPSDPRFAGYFPTTYASEIQLDVVTRTEPTIEAAVSAPEAFFDLAEGPEVLGRQAVYQLPGLPFLALVGLAPLGLCAAWYLAWRVLYPDAARRVQIQQSRAARQALQALRNGAQGSDGGRVAGVAAEFLRQRLGLHSAEPTPGEVEGFLRKSGASAELSVKYAQFFRDCYAARYAPANLAPPPAELAGSLTRFIHALESELWVPRK